MSISPKCARCGKSRDRHRDSHCPLPGVRNLWSKKDTWKPKWGLRKVSKKLAPRLKLYSALRKEFLEKNRMCFCGAPSMDVHHIGGRGSNLNATDTWLAVCRFHHDEIHRNPNEARKLGLLK